MTDGPDKGTDKCTYCGRKRPLHEVINENDERVRSCAECIAFRQPKDD